MKSNAKRKNIWKLPMVISLSVFIIMTLMIITEYVTDANAKSEFENLAMRVSGSEENFITSDDLITPASEKDIADTYNSQQDEASDTTYFLTETELSLYESTMLLDKYSGLYEENHDLGGWIKIEGTVIDYPVMYTPDDPEKYLHLSFAGEYSSRGVPFIDENCSLNPESQNIIVYGHHMKNGSMFAAITEYEDCSFYEEHKNIYFSTVYAEYTYEVVCAFETDAYEAKNMRCYSAAYFTDEAEFEKYVSELEKLALYDTGIQLSYGNEFLVLSTCSYHTKEGRFVVIARKITKRG